MTQSKKPSDDSLGGFLSQYGEYLEGSRSYSDLPIPTASELKAAERSNQSRDDKKR